MNLSWEAYEHGLHPCWEAYEHGLKLLSIPPFSEHPDYTKICTLQTNLQECISQACAHGDTQELCVQRKCIIVELDSMLKTTGKMFIDLCSLYSETLMYIIYVYKVIQKASVLFSGIGQIWADQCQDICKQFHLRPHLGPIDADASQRSVDLHYIDKLIVDLIQLTENFKISCLSDQRTRGSLQDKRNKIYGKLVHCIEKIQCFDNYKWEKLILWDQAESFFNMGSSSAEQNVSLSSYNDTSEEDDSSLPKGVVETSKQPFNPEPVKIEGEMNHKNLTEHIPQVPSEEHIDSTKLREFIESKFSLDEFRTLCADIAEECRKNGMDERFSFDTLQGDNLPSKARELVAYFERRDKLPYVIKAVRKRRDKLIL